MSVRTDVINLTVNVNGNKAQNELNELRKKAGDVKLEMDGLKKGTQEYIDKKVQLAGITTQMGELKKSIGLASLSQKELVAELNKLNSLKGSVVPFSKEFKDLQVQIDGVKNRLYDVKNGVQGMASVFSKVKDEVKQFGVAAAAYLGFQFITSQFHNIIVGAGKLSDQLADLRRVAGLTAEEATSLNSALGKIDTRTSVSSLRDIAVVAGKLGVAKEDIFSFTKAVDQLVVSLGDELGNADEITTQLGKILNVFDGKITGDNISKLGNAIVDLANKGVATGGFVVDFTQRLSGLAKTSNLSLAAVLGLGAGLEENGAKVESAATAISKLINTIALDVPKAAKIAGQDFNVFADSFAKKPQEALLAYAAGLQKNKASFAEIAASFKDAGEEGARVVSTLATLGNRTDFFNQKIADTGTALANTSSITTAFALKNETFGASLDKLGKAFNKVVTSSTVVNFLKGAVEGVVSFLNALKELPAWIDRNSTALQLILVGVILLRKAYILSALDIINETAAKIYNAVVTKAIAVANNIAIASQAAYITITNLLTARITLATAAQRLWNIATAAGMFPLGAIVIAAGVLAIALNTLIGRTKQLTAEQRVNAEVQQKVAESTTEEISKIDLLKRVIENTNGSLENRKKALAALIAINPAYLEGLTLENIKTQEGKNILDKYIASLRTKAEIEAKNAVLLEKLTAKQKAFSSLRSVGPEFASQTDDQLEKFFRDADKESKGQKIFGLGPDAKFAGVNIPEITKTFDQIKFLSDDLAKVATKNVEDVIGKTADVVTKTSVTTIAALKAQIKALDDGFENIAVSDTKALKQNRDSRKKLQDELDGLEGKKSPGQKKDDGEFKRLQKDAAQFAEDLKKLRKKVSVDEADENEKEIAAATQKYQDLQERALKYFKANVTSSKDFHAQEKDIEDLFNKEMAVLIQKRFEKQSAKEYDKSLQDLKDFFTDQRDLAAQNFASGLTDQRGYDAALKALDLEEKNNLVNVAVDYSKTVKKAADDVHTFRRTAEEATTKDTIEETQKRKELAEQEALAKGKLAVLNTKNDPAANLKAQKDLLQLQFEQDSQFLDKKSNLYKEKQAELNAQLADADKQDDLRKIDAVLNYVNFFQDAIGSLNTIITNKENKQLAEDRKRNDAKKKNYKSQLDNKLISQAQYDAKTQALDDAQAKKEGEARRKQAQREKAMAIFGAIVNTAAAIVKTFVEFGWPIGIPLAAAMAVTGGLQVAAIASAPLPEAGEGDWFRKGDKHKDKSGGIPILIERDEAVMKAAAMTDSKQYTVTGTPSQITSKLNHLHGGVNWAGGAVIQMPRFRTDRPAGINMNMPRIMANGGVLSGFNGVLGKSHGVDQSALLVQLTQEVIAMKNETIATHREGISETRNFNGRLRAHVSIKEIKETQKKYDNARKAGGMNQ